MPFQKGHKLNVGNKYAKGLTPWNKGKKGCKNKGSFTKDSVAFKGRKHTKEAKEKMRQKHFKNKKTTQYGYILIYAPKHPLANRNYVREHRLLIEKHLGRYLTAKEIVHHINGIKNDNRLENLALLKNSSEHMKIHNRFRKKCPLCGKLK